MKRILRVSLLVLLLFLLVSPLALAAWEYYFPTTVIDTSSTARTYYPVILGYTGQTLIDAGYIDANGLDTNMQIGASNVKYMLSTTKALGVVPNLPSGGQAQLDLYTGYTGPPATTGFPVVVGDGGYVTRADHANLEFGNQFTADMKGYVNLSESSNLIYKWGAFKTYNPSSTTIKSAIVALDPIDVTPAAGAWNNIDVSAYVPAGATGAIVQLYHSAAGVSSNISVREDGGADNRLYAVSNCFSVVGLTAGRIFEGYAEGANSKIYLTGYTGTGWHFKTNDTDVSLGGIGAWTDIDLTASTTATTSAALIEVINTDNANDYTVGLRKDGSADARNNFFGASGEVHAPHFWALVGLDAATQILEGYIGNVAVDFYLSAYYDGSDLVMATNGTDKSLGGAGWADIDVSAVAPANATYAVFEVVDSADRSHDFGFQANSGTTNFDNDAKGHNWAIVPIDNGRIAEGYIENADIDFYFLGYAGTSTTMPERLSVTAIGLTSGIRRVVTSADTVNLVISVYTDAGALIDDDTVALGAVTVPNTDASWIFMGDVIPYMDYYKHSTVVGGWSEKAKYQPVSMLAGTTIRNEDNPGTYDGTVTWGTNTSITIAYGGMVGYESTDATTSTATGFTMSTSLIPSTWFAQGENLAALPMYDAFNSVSTQIGIPVQTIYFWIVLGLAFGAALFLMTFTRSALLGIMAMNIILFIGSSQTIIPMWIPFAMLIVDIAIMYLYRQVSY